MEIIAVILTLWGVILTIRSHIWCWPVGILSCIAYMYVFGIERIYFQFIIQIIFILQSIHGWYYWGKKKEIQMKDGSMFDLGIYLIVILFITSLSATLLDGKTNNPQLTLDILTTLLSILGTWYLAIRNVLAWIVWIIADIFFVIMFLDQKMYWSMGLYLFLTFLAIKGLITWGRSLKTV